MNLEFVQEGTNYIAEAVVKGDFNLYVELEDNGRLVVYKMPLDGTEYSCLYLHPSQLRIFDFVVKNKYGERKIQVRVAQPVIKATLTEIPNAITETTQIRQEVDEISGTNPNSQSAQTPELDNNEEYKSFLEGYTNDQKLKDVIPQEMSEAEYQAVRDLIK